MLVKDDIFRYPSARFGPTSNLHQLRISRWFFNNMTRTLHNPLNRSARHPGSRLAQRASPLRYDVSSALVRVALRTTTHNNLSKTKIGNKS